MAEKILDKLNELDASSAVTPEEFEKVWGISKEEHLSRMMDYVHQRKAQAAQKEKQDVEVLKQKVAELNQKVEQLEQELNLVKRALTAQVPTPPIQILDPTRCIAAPKVVTHKDNPYEADNMLFRMMSKGDSFIIKPLIGFDSLTDEEDLEEAWDGDRPKRRKK